MGLNCTGPLHTDLPVHKVGPPHPQGRASRGRTNGGLKTALSHFQMWIPNRGWKVLFLTQGWLHLQTQEPAVESKVKCRFSTVRHLGPRIPEMYRVQPYIFSGPSSDYQLRNSTGGPPHPETFSASPGDSDTHARRGTCSRQKETRNVC